MKASLVFGSRGLAFTCPCRGKKKRMERAIFTYVEGPTIEEGNPTELTTHCPYCGEVYHIKISLKK